MKRLQTTLAYFLAGFLVPTVWYYLAAPFGYLAGFVAAIVVIAPVWYLVHYRGMIIQDQEAPVLDMGGAVGLAVLTRDILNKGVGNLPASLQTLLFMGLGAVLAGCAAHFLSRKEVGK